MIKRDEHLTLDDVRVILRKRLKREPSYDDIAEALNGIGWIDINREVSENKKLAKAKPNR